MKLRIVALFVALALVPLAAGCNSVSAPKGSGFLDDYSMLKPYPKYAGTWRWEKPDIDLRDYDSLVFDAVEVRVAPGSAAAALGPETLAKCAAKFREVLVETISPFYSVVDQAGAHTLRVRVALTDVQPGASDVDVGGAGIEAELLDASTGERLAASMSHGVSGATTEPADADVPERWRGVAGAFRERARRFLDYLDSHDVGGE